MPDLHLIIARDLLTWRELQDLCTDLKHVAAHELSGIDYSGRYVTLLAPDDVDVYTFEFDPAKSATNKVAKLVVIGFDWPERMATLKDQLGALQQVLEVHVRAAHPDLPPIPCPVNFAPVRQDHWVY